LLLAAIGAPNARAGSIKYTFTGAGNWAGSHFTYVSTTGYLSYGESVTPTDGLAVLFGMNPTVLTSIEFDSSSAIIGQPGGFDFLAFETGTYDIGAVGTYKFYDIHGGDTYQGSLVISSTATPEPSSLFLFGTSLLGLAPFRRKLFGK